jgi:methylated-DNA-[protein]-cysteine S-methyltransferase
MRSCEYDSPVGVLTLIASDAGLRAILWPGERPPSPVAEDPTDPVLRATVAQLDEYFAGRRTAFDLPLDPVGSQFQQRAWAVLRAIPYGSTISYAEQAGRLGDRRKARAVGAANGRNPLPLVVPCHRVVASSGALTGFAGGVPTKQWLLDFERRASMVKQTSRTP